MCRFLLLVCVIPVFIVNGKEYAHDLEKEGHYDEEGEHDVDFDHQAILGSRDMHEQFAKLSPEESKIRLDGIVKKMDADSDGYVTKEELQAWVVLSFRNLDEEDAKHQMKQHDTNGDGKVTWEEYLKEVYNLEKHDLEDMDKDKNAKVQGYADMIKDDVLKFNMADENTDGILEEKEYYAFQHPWNYDHMHILEVKNALKDHDANGDGKISLEEYLGQDDDRDEETRIIDSDNFRAYDVDGDGQLGNAEVKEWVIPDYDAAAEDEAKHLIEHSDLDADGKLVRAEILDKYEMWVGSSATDYGRVLHKEEL